MELNPLIQKHIQKFKSNINTIDLKEQTIEFVNIFNEKEKKSLNENFIFYNKITDKPTKGKILIIKSKNRFSETYHHRIFLIYHNEEVYRDCFIKNNENRLKHNITISSFVSLYFLNKEETKVNSESFINKLNRQGFNSILEISNYYSDYENKIKPSNKYLPILYSKTNFKLNLPKSLYVNMDLESRNRVFYNFSISKLNIDGQNIYTTHLKNLFKVENHADCCGAKVAFNHNAYINTKEQKKDFLKDLNSNIQFEFICKKVQLLGKAPFVAHLTDKMLYSSHTVYKALIKNYKRKKLYRYKNPNSSNHINIYHIDTPYEDAVSELRLYDLFLNKWFSSVRFSFNNKKFYNINDMYAKKPEAKTKKKVVVKKGNSKKLSYKMEKVSGSKYF